MLGTEMMLGAERSDTEVFESGGGMTKRYREMLDAVECAAGTTARGGEEPVTFTWRGDTYRVVTVLGHWREDPGWWQRGGARPDGGETIRIEQADLWRGEAQNGHPGRGVYELVRRGDQWRLDRVWD